MAKRQALGKGLSALIPVADKIRDEETFFQCPIELIEPNPLQPRQEFKDSEMEELVNSIKESGIITPVLISRAGLGYQLIAGERRWRAAQKAGLERIPAVVREASPIESLELALIENIHRQDLNPIEEALAYQRWLEDTKTTQEELAKKLGRERSTITNMLRLLKLPEIFQKDLINNRLSMGHARVLAGVKNEREQKRFRDLILKRNLSVRQLEAMVKRPNLSTRKRKDDETESYLKSVTDNMKRFLGTKVEIKRRGKRGTINIHFTSDEELGRLIERLS
jgi:ParB family chromosome partitioning protein